MERINFFIIFKYFGQGSVYVRFLYKFEFRLLFWNSLHCHLNYFLVQLCTQEVEEVQKLHVQSSRLPDCLRFFVTFSFFFFLFLILWAQISFANHQFNLQRETTILTQDYFIYACLYRNIFTDRQRLWDLVNKYITCIRSQNSLHTF